MVQEENILQQVDTSDRGAGDDGLRSAWIACGLNGRGRARPSAAGRCNPVPAAAVPALRRGGAVLPGSPGCAGVPAPRAPRHRRCRWSCPDCCGPADRVRRDRRGPASRAADRCPAIAPLAIGHHHAHGALRTVLVAVLTLSPCPGCRPIFAMACPISRLPFCSAAIACCCDWPASSSWPLVQPRRASASPDRPHPGLATPRRSGR